MDKQWLNQKMFNREVQRCAGGESLCLRATVCRALVIILLMLILGFLLLSVQPAAAVLTITIRAASLSSKTATAAAMLTPATTASPCAAMSSSIGKARPVPILS